MPTITSRFSLIVLAAVIASVSIGANAAGSGGYRTKSIEQLFYSGPDKTNQVGWRFLPCVGPKIERGKITNHWKRFESPCDNYHSSRPGASATLTPSGNTQEE